MKNKLILLENIEKCGVIVNRNDLSSAKYWVLNLKTNISQDSLDFLITKLKCLFTCKYCILKKHLFT